MSWTLFAQLFMLIILIYLCVRACIHAYFEQKALSTTSIVSAEISDRRADALNRQQLHLPLQ